MNAKEDSGEHCAICGSPLDPEDPLCSRPKLKPAAYYWFRLKNSAATYLVCGGSKDCIKHWIKLHGKPHYVESFATMIPPRIAPEIVKTAEVAPNEIGKTS